MTRKTKPYVKMLRALSALTLPLFASPALADSPGFTSPSGNITCYMSDLADNDEQPAPLPERPMVCLIFDAEWTLPPFYGDDDPTCDLDRTRMIILPFDAPAREQWVCHGDIFWSFNGSISYGTEWEFINYSCQMETTGVSCENATGNGFLVSRASRTLN